jgi:hypothetical protein
MDVIIDRHLLSELKQMVNLQLKTHSLLRKTRPPGPWQRKHVVKVLTRMPRRILNEQSSQRKPGSPDAIWSRRQ